KLERISREGIAMTGTPTGFVDLDELTGGLQPGNLIVLAARPSMGKSALVTNIAENAAVEHGKPVAMFSLEMSETELAQRFIASQAKLNGDDLRKGRVKPDRWPKVVKATEKLAASPLYVDDSSDIGILEVRAKARRLHARRESGQIEQDADLVMFIYRDEYYNRDSERPGEADVIVAKHRNGPVGDVILTFLSRYPKFANLYRDQSIDAPMPAMNGDDG